MWKTKSHDSSKSSLSQDSPHGSLPHRTIAPSFLSGPSSPVRDRSPRSSSKLLRAMTPRSRTASPSSRLGLPRSNGNSDLDVAAPRGRQSPIARTSTPLDKALKHAATTLRPYLKAMVAFASAREFESKPSHWRLKQAEKKQAYIALTVS